MKKNLRLFIATATVSCLSGNAAPAQSPITSITTKMTHVSGDLAKKETGEPVQKVEKAIVHDLDELIAALEKECQACRNGIKRNNPTRPLADSVIRSGTGGIGSLVEPGKSNKDWAKLSDRERDRILQSMTEGFPPEYRTVLERYYRRLAEEKTVPSGGEGAQPQQKAAAKPSDKP
jgi:hypothetical protein